MLWAEELGRAEAPTTKQEVRKKPLRQTQGVLGVPEPSRQEVMGWWPAVISQEQAVTVLKAPQCTQCPALPQTTQHEDFLSKAKVRTH